MNYPPQGEGINQSSLLKASIDGNITGTQTLISTGTMTLAGGNNITLSQDGNAITISAAAIGAGSFTAGASNLGNLSGTTGVISNQLVIVGGDNVTLSQSINIQSATITIDAQSQSQQTQNIIRDVNIGGNTSGTTANITSGTLRLVGGYNITLSQNQNTITMSGPEALTAVVSNLGNTAGLTGAPVLMDKLIFVGGNNITLSQTYIGEDVTITIDAQTQSLQTQSIVRDVNIIGNTSGTTADVTSGTLFLAGGNNITLSQNDNSITISAQSQSLQTQSLIRDVNIGNNTSGTTANITSGTLLLAGGNNITLSQNQNSITISANDALLAGMSNLGNTSGTTGLVYTQLVFAGGDNITLNQSIEALGLSATITIDAQTQSLQTQSIVRDANIIGNTSGTTADITSGTIYIAGGNNITLSQAGNSITISGPTETVSQFSAGISNIGNTSGTSGVVSHQLVFAGGNNITLSQSTGVGNDMGHATITISAQSQSIQTQNLIDVTVAGNTSGTLALISSGTLTIAGGNNITLSQDGNAITISAFDDTVTQFSIGVSTVGNTSGNTGTFDNRLVLAGGNNITLSQSIDGQSGTITISAFTQTVQTQGLIKDVNIIGNTSGTTADITSGTLNIAGGNNITLSQNANSITISAAAVGAGSFTAGMSNLGNTAGTTGVVNNRLVFAGGNNMTISQSIDGQSATMTFDFATIGAGSFTAGMSNLGNTSGTSGAAQNQLVFAGGNNITLSQSKDGQSATITISAFTQTVQTQNLVDITLAGNTSGTLALISSGTLTLVGGNDITLSQDGNAITISMAEQSQQTQNIIRNIDIIGNTSGTTAHISSGTMSIAGGNNITLSQNQNSITISANDALLAGMSNLGNTSGTTGLVYTQLVFAGGENITLNQSIEALGLSATITINGPADTISMFTAGMSNLGNTSGTSGTFDNRLIFVGGNNITLSQSIDLLNHSGTITISAASQSQQTQSIVRDVNIIGNTSGTTADITSGTLFLAGDNNITLSQVGNSITISAQSQTLQTQNLVDVTMSGNTSGTLVLISSGTLTLVGGNNITLNQDGNAVTISARDKFNAGVSNIGNTSGTTGAVENQIVFVGGNNVTLSQSVNVGSATITMSAHEQTIQTQNIIQDVHIIGNISGTTADISSGTLHLAGGNNITLSQNDNSITISAQSQTLQTQNLVDVTMSGNTSGTLVLISSGTLTLVGGNNITLNQDGNAVTISARDKFNAGVSNIGNTSGTTGAVENQIVFVGGNNVTLSQSVNVGSATITMSAASQSQQTQNIIRQINAGGNTSGTVTAITSGTMTLAGGNNITLSQVGNVITISAFNQSVPTLSYWANADQSLNTLASSNGIFWLFPLDPTHALFPGNMTANTALFNFNVAGNNLSRTFTITWKVGVYTMNGVSLSLLNSVSTSIGNSTASAAFSSLYSGERFITLDSSVWSSVPAFSNTKYYVGMIGNSNTAGGGNTVGLSQFGFRILESGTVRSGTVGVGMTSGNTSMGAIPWIGVSGATRDQTLGIPTNIQLSELVKTGAFYGFVPHIQFNNISSNF